MIRRPASRFASLVVPVVGVALLAGCGQTIDLRDEVDAVPAASTLEVPADDVLPLDGTLDELLPAILASWRGLDQRVIDGDAAEPLARIETAWAAAEPLVRADHPTSLFGMQQAIDLARSAVERRRPADASKGFRLAIELSDEILTR
ncbi:hypothetical protein BH23ACT3_BH23ACT3_09230 [soil metagenome]